ncbi:hypothetical protein PTKIN_Ptkin04bG0027800 [Pterospermum kingtungense]
MGATASGVPYSYPPMAGMLIGRPAVDPHRRRCLCPASFAALEDAGGLMMGRMLMEVTVFRGIWKDKAYVVIGFYELCISNALAASFLSSWEKLDSLCTILIYLAQALHFARQELVFNDICGFCLVVMV